MKVAQHSWVLWHSWFKKEKIKAITSSTGRRWFGLCLCMKRKGGGGEKEIRNWYSWLHLFSHLLYKRTVNISSVNPVMNWAFSQRGPHASCSSVTPCQLHVSPSSSSSFSSSSLWQKWLLGIDYNAAVQYHQFLSFVSGSAWLNWCWAAQIQWV